MRGTELSVVSNRLPIRLSRNQHDEWIAHPSSGGLVAAMQPLLEQRGGSWTGWVGATSVSPRTLRSLLDSAADRYALRPIPLGERERRGYYLGYANQALWPTLHGLDAISRSQPVHRSIYREVNRKFAAALAGDGSGAVWIHDYHLFFVAEEMRRLGSRRPLGFFLHTPFPPPHSLRRLPGYPELVRAMGTFDSIGFQTARDRTHFLEAAAMVHAFEETSRVSGDRTARVATARRSLRRRTGVYPISIDPRTWSERSRTPKVTARVREIRAELDGVSLLLGVDRLDYSKGIPQKVRGFARALERDPSLPGRVTLLQLTVPSREEVPAYARHRRELEALIDEVNSRFATDGWTPIRHIHGNWDQDELTAHYCAADVALVTPLIDGMNLVAKEFCAAQTGSPGVLILSRHAGAAQELGRSALLVEPRRECEVAEAIRRALRMPREERARRMEGLRRVIECADLERWAGNLLGSLHAGSPGTREGGIPWPGALLDRSPRRRLRRARPGNGHSPLEWKATPRAGTPGVGGEHEPTSNGGPT